MASPRRAGVALPPDGLALGEAELLELVRGERLPTHIAVIMDGNGRWATQRGLPRVAGHSEGVKATRSIVRAADLLGIRYLTLYAFSSENWSRPGEEVAALMTLLEQAVDQELPELMARNISLRVIGRPNGVPGPVRRAIDRVAHATARNTGMVLVVAFNYGGRDEIVDACRRLARQVQTGQLAPEAIDETHIGRALYTADLPDPDLLVRTSGELRVSNFLLWQIAYTELWVTPILWPDFGPRDLYRAIAEYQRRERRFGGV
jgi:undecaprenyl diphosphate synthase